MENIFLTDEANHKEILCIWEKSVRATHDFLTNDDILEIKKDVIGYLPFLKIYAYKNGDEIAGFIAIDKKKIEMLFVSPKHFQKGTGRALVNFAVKNMGADAVDVNEQNSGARKFYERMGFEVKTRFAEDMQGRAFPLLRMKLKKKVSL